MVIYSSKNISDKVMQKLLPFVDYKKPDFAYMSYGQPHSFYVVLNATEYVISYSLSEHDDNSNQLYVYIQTPHDFTTPMTTITEEGLVKIVINNYKTKRSKSNDEY